MVEGGGVDVPCERKDSLEKELWGSLAKGRYIRARKLVTSNPGEVLWCIP